MFSKKTVLWLFFFSLIVAIAIALVYLFKITASIAGDGPATIGISILVVGLFTLFLVSAGFTIILLFTRQRGLIQYRPIGLLDRLLRLWDRLPSNHHPVQTVIAGEKLTSTEENQEPWPDEFTLTDIEELLEAIASGKGRGRKSYTADESRFRAVRDWSILQMRGTSTTLQDFLNERFGYHPDGSPMVPTSTFYGWRRKFIEELQEYKDTKKK